VTAIADLLKPADRQRLAARMRDLDKLADLMRRPGLLSSPDELPPLHRRGRDSTTERTTRS
jgi:hypothetical protein